MIALQGELGKDKIEYVYSENMFVVDDAVSAIRSYARRATTSFWHMVPVWLFGSGDRA